MTKTNKYFNDVFQMLESKNFKTLKNYIIENSTLPGRMANISLISTIANIIQENPSISNSSYLTFNTWFNAKSDGNDSNTEVF